jgi:hypothetical protein
LGKKGKAEERNSERKSKKEGVGEGRRERGKE